MERLLNPAAFLAYGAGTLGLDCGPILDFGANYVGARWFRAPGNWTVNTMLTDIRLGAARSKTHA